MNLTDNWWGELSAPVKNIIIFESTVIICLIICVFYLNHIIEYNYSRGQNRHYFRRIFQNNYELTQ